MNFSFILQKIIEHDEFRQLEKLFRNNMKAFQNRKTFWSQEIILSLFKENESKCQELFSRQYYKDIHLKSSFDVYLWKSMNLDSPLAIFNSQKAFFPEKLNFHKLCKTPSFCINWIKFLTKFLLKNIKEFITD